jgi:hypothetical protein
MKLLVWYQMGRLKSTKINKIFRREDNRFEKKFANREFGEKNSPEPDSKFVNERTQRKKRQGMIPCLFSTRSKLKNYLPVRAKEWTQPCMRLLAF